MLSKQVKSRIRQNRRKRSMTPKMRVRAADGIGESLLEVILRNSPEQPDLIPTGLPSLDQMFKGGFKRGDLIIFSCKPVGVENKVDMLSMYRLTSMYRQILADTKDLKIAPFNVSLEMDLETPPDFKMDWILGLERNAEQSDPVVFTTLKERKPIDGQERFYIQEPLTIAPMGHQNPDGSVDIKAWSVVDSFTELQASEKKEEGDSNAQSGPQAQ
jgi:hypothetical protein